MTHRYWWDVCPLSSETTKCKPLSSCLQSLRKPLSFMFSPFLPYETDDGVLYTTIWRKAWFHHTTPSPLHLSGNEEMWGTPHPLPWSSGSCPLWIVGVGIALTNKPCRSFLLETVRDGGLSTRQLSGNRFNKRTTSVLLGMFVSLPWACMPRSPYVVLLIINVVSLLTLSPRIPPPRFVCQTYRSNFPSVLYRPHQSSAEFVWRMPVTSPQVLIVPCISLE